MLKRYGLGRYAAGAAAARTGDEMSGPALLLAGLAATGSTVTATTLLAALTVAAAAGGPLLGALLDRSPRPGVLLAGTLLGYATGLLVVLGCLGRAPLGPTIAVAVLAGLLGPAIAGGWTSQLPRTVPAHRLDRANAVDAMTFNAAGLLGPLLAGLVAHRAGAGTAVVVSAAFIGLALPAALLLPRTASASVTATGPGGPPAPRTPVRADLAAGFRVIARTRALARPTLSSVISCAGQGMFLACAPLLGERVLGGPARGAALLAVIAASALGANALLARRRTPLRPETVLAISAAVLAVALVLLATAHPLTALAGAVLLGAGEGPQLTALFAIRHREAPERLRAQIFTTGASLKITGFAIGTAAAGPIAALSLPGALLTAAAVQLLALLALLAPLPLGARPRRRTPPARRVPGPRRTAPPDPATPALFSPAAVPPAPGPRTTSPTPRDQGPGDNAPRRPRD
ncbi:MFS transporter [Streptomyces sp. NPDC006798]|uniref:MFS transporter n=1 Tax=Streptomyces sp. NPDC006798 TaxID=3155462 RepID=UPI00340528E9